MAEKLGSIDPVKDPLAYVSRQGAAALFGLHVQTVHPEAIAPAPLLEECQSWSMAVYVDEHGADREEQCGITADEVLQQHLLGHGVHPGRDADAVGAGRREREVMAAMLRSKPWSFLLKITLVDCGRSVPLLEELAASKDSAQQPARLSSPVTPLQGTWQMPEHCSSRGDLDSPIRYGSCKS